MLDTFQNHKTLGELLLIDRVTNMTSACGVVTSIMTDAYERKHVVPEDRSILNGHQAVTVSFPLGREGITLQLVQETERRLYADGRHTFLYQPRPGDDIERITELLNEAGIIVLLVADPQIPIPESLEQKEHYYSGWEKDVVISSSEIARYISHIAALTTEVVVDRDYI